MKKVTKTIQPAQVEMIIELQATQSSIKKSHLHHKSFDHSHGRINKTPFGLNYGPGCF